MAEQLRGLYADGRALFEAEIGFQKTRAKFMAKQAGGATKLILVGVIFLTAAFMALVIGTLIALMPILGPWGSTFIVTIGALLLACACFLWALTKVKTAIRVFKKSADDISSDG